MIQDYEIPKHRLSFLVEQIGNLNTRAAKIGCTPITLEVLSERMEVITNHHISQIMRTSDIKKVLVYTKVRIEGQAPKYEGWTFVATIQHLPAVGKKETLNIIRSLPDIEIPEYFRGRQVCDHCGHDRYRKDTFIIQHETGQWKQVGRQCLKDFLGHKSPHVLAEQAQLFIEALDLVQDAVEGKGFQGFHVPTYINLKSYLDWVAGVIRVRGWVSCANAKMKNCQSTADLVASLLSPVPIKDPRYRAEILKLCQEATPTEKDKQLSTDAIEWAKCVETTNDYLYNLNTIAKSGSITENLMGYAASIIPAYAGKIYYQCLLNRCEYQKSKQSNHFGTIGKRETFTLTLDKLIPLESQFGITMLHLFHDAQGNKAVWFASKKTKLQVGDIVNCKATIKEHNEREGIKQTILSRVSVS